MSPVTAYALEVLGGWYGCADIVRETGPLNRKSALRWKAIGIIKHDMALNSEPVRYIPMFSTDQLVTHLKNKPQR